MKKHPPSATQRPLLSPDEIAAESIFVATLRLAHAFGASFDDLFKEYGLTSAQYNTLRVLRDAGPQGLSCQEISAALIQRDPDITRLTDRLEERGLVQKERGVKDRRVVGVRLTDKGLKLVHDLDFPVTQRHISALSALSPSEENQLLALLRKVLTTHSKFLPQGTSSQF
ncbi:MAG TPA: MarR family transcriptional regulator [Abditibacterium sp.]|jgi:DNA-binding MarR family transcriptional regulator